MPDIIKEIFLKFITVSLIASALILVIQLISPMLKKRFSARWRYWAWMMLALWLLIPVTVPLSQAPIQISIPDTAIVHAEIPPASFESQTGNVTEITTPQQNTPNDNTVQENSASEAEAETATFFTTISTFLSGYTVLDLIIAVWAAGTVIVLFCRWVAAMRFRSKLRRRWRPCDSPAVVRSIRGAMQGMGFHKELDIKFCKEVKSPFMTGLFRPILVLPEQDFDPYLLAHIVRHEITHYRRRDLWYKTVVNLATAMHWFNPFVHVMGRVCDLDLELVCDELVTKNHDLVNRKAYGESILLTVKPGMDRRPAALTTSFSRGAKNLKERFESIMFMKAKNSGIVFLALIIMIAVLASCGTGLNINKLDWTLYTNTEWRCEEGDADLFFKDRGTKGIAFDLYVSQMCIVENVETAGKLKSSDEGYVDTFDGEWGGTSVKASITFSPDGDYVIITITEAGGVTANLGEYRFVKANTVNIENIYGKFRNIRTTLHEYGLWLEFSLNLDGTASLSFCWSNRQLYEESTGTFTIENNQIMYKRISDNRSTVDESLYARSEKYESLPEITAITIIDNDTLKVEDSYFITLEIASYCEYHGFVFDFDDVILSRYVDDESVDGDNPEANDDDSNSDDANKTIMPDVTGMTYDEAKRVLVSIGLKVGNVSYIPSSLPKDTVWGQTYNAGGYVPAGAVIDLILSSGDANKTIMPDLTGLTYDEAKSALENNGLTVGSVTYVSSSQPKYTVWGQEYNAGGYVPVGATVDLILSSGE